MPEPEGVLVIDEWLWSDLGEENGPVRQREAVDFLEAVFNKCDKIVTVKGSPFERKASLLWRYSDVTRRGIARYYQRTFAYNSVKNMLVEESELPPLASEIAEDVKPDDRYLIRAQQKTGAELVVTTDGPLMDALKRHGIPFAPRETFVVNYIAKYGPKA